MAVHFDSPVTTYPIPYNKLNTPAFKPSVHTAPLEEIISNIEELDLKSFICPISLEKFEDPVVDRCGHSFSKAHIHAYGHSKTKDGKTFPCPLDPSKMISFVGLKKNYSLGNAVEDTEKLISDSKSTIKPLEDRLSALEQRLTRQEDMYCTVIKELHKNQNENILLRDQQKIRKKQIKNLTTMTLYDRVNCVFFYSYLETVQNRGLTKYEIGFSKSTV